MAKSKAVTRRRRNNRNGFKLPVAILAGFGPGFIRLYQNSYAMDAFTNEASRIYLGVDWQDQKWNPAWMKRGTFPIVLGFLVHYVVGVRMGVNRMLSRAGVPIIRV
jgi:hypothetical protein